MILVAIVLAAIVLVVVWLSKSSKESQYEARRKLVRDRCRTDADRSTILVLLATNGSPHGCARTLFEIFEKARCPQRISVAIHDTIRFGAS